MDDETRPRKREVALKGLQLDESCWGLVHRQVDLAKVFAFGRLFRDARLTWPARVGPILATEFEPRRDRCHGHPGGVRPP